MNTGGLFALSWLACIVVLSACRLLIWRHYKAAGLAADIERLGRYAVAASCLSGLIWGVGLFIGFFLAPAHKGMLTRSDAGAICSRCSRPARQQRSTCRANYCSAKVRIDLQSATVVIAPPPSGTALISAVVFSHSVYCAPE